MYCKYCGKELKDDARFCPYCGKDQKPDEEDPKANAKKVQAKKTLGRRTTKDSHPAVKTSSLVAIAVVAVVIIVSIFGVTRNAGGSGKTESADSILASGRTDIMWVVGEGPKTVDSHAKASNKEASYSDQIDTVMTNFEDYIKENEDALAEADADYQHHSHAELLEMDSAVINGGCVNAGYRMFELSCVIAKEEDSSGDYAYAVTDAAENRYQSLDAKTEYGNIQEINALYRCAEMLGCVMYELGEEASVSKIDAIFTSITDQEPDVDNFMECRGNAMTAVYECLYGIANLLDLPTENWSSIQYDYETWDSDMEIVDSEPKHVTTNASDQRFWGSLYYTSELLVQLASGLDRSDQYAADINELEEAIASYDGQHGDHGSSWETSMMEESTRLLAIVARLLA